MVLFGTSLALLACVALAAWWQRWRESPRRSKAKAERKEAAMFAAAITERAAAAVAVAEQVRAGAHEADQERARAFDELTRVQQEHDRAAEDYQRTAQERVEQAGGDDGQRELARAAFAAYRRGDLSQDQLWWVWRWGSGWDRELERREQQLMQLRAARREAQLRYRAATNRARTAAQQAEVADVQARALIEEAAGAAEDADVTA